MVYSSMRPVLPGLNLVRSMISMLVNKDDTNSEQSSAAELRHGYLLPDLSIYLSSSGAQGQSWSTKRICELSGGPTNNARIVRGANLIACCRLHSGKCSSASGDAQSQFLGGENANVVHTFRDFLGRFARASCSRPHEHHLCRFPHAAGHARLASRRLCAQIGVGAAWLHGTRHVLAPKAHADAARRLKQRGTAPCCLLQRSRPAAAAHRLRWRWRRWAFGRHAGRP